jgi:SAM-dependent methyltransferase
MQPEMKTLLTRIQNRIHQAVKTRGKYAFIARLMPQARVLDVGCGNNSPARFKLLRPDCGYIGLDVGNYRQNEPAADYADEYLLVEPAAFAAAIERYQGQLDAVISSHNLEHCLAPDRVMEAMLAAIRPGGRIYLSFPCEQSVRFPRRKGNLNFFDDPTHRAVPDWKATLTALRRAGMRIDFSAARYRPLLLAVVGLLFEPVSAVMGRNGGAGSTWSLYGFESVIWASKPYPASATGGDQHA